jgi:uncharacterized protein YndB with AHSA1/START domain
VTDVHVSQVFDAPRELVFAAWTDPDQVASWWAPPGLEIPRDSVQIEPRVGGCFHLTMVGGGTSHPYRSEIVEFEPPELIVMRAEAIPDAGIAETITRIEFEADGERTRLTITSGPYTDEMRPNAEAGWLALVENLEAALAGS